MSSIKARRTNRPEDIETYPLWVPHHPEEPSYGLLARTLDRNLASGSFRSVAAALGGSGPSGIGLMRADHVARICEAHAHAVAAASPDISNIWQAVVLGHTFDRIEFSTTLGRRWCPACLEEHGAHLVWWDLRFFSCCPRHGVRLRNRCDCGKTLHWSDSAFGSCGCGRRPADCEAEIADGDEIAPNAYFLARLRGEPTDHPVLDGCSFSDALNVVRYVGYAALNPHADWKAIVRQRGDEVLRAGWIGLSDFPASYREVLDGAIERARLPDRRYGTRRVFGDRFVRWLIEGEPTALNGMLLREFREHTVKNMLLPKRTSWGVEKTTITLSDAAKITRMGVANLRPLLERRGYLDEGGRGVPARLNRKAMIALAIELEGGMNQLQVMSELKAAKRVVVDLVAAGHLECSRSKRSNTVHHFPPEAVARLLEKLKALVRPLDAPRSDVFNIHAASRATRMTVGKLVNEAIEGRIAVVGHDPKGVGLRSILIHVDRNRRKRRVLADGLLSAMDVSDRYGIFINIVLSLLRVGALKAKKGARTWLVAPEDAADFFDRHSMLATYAVRLGTSPRCLAASLRGEGVYPVVGPPDMANTFYLRSQLEAFVASRINHDARSSAPGARKGDRRIAERSIASV